jgi:hypothetical protein
MPKAQIHIVLNEVLSFRSQSSRAKVKQLTTAMFQRANYGSNVIPGEHVEVPAVSTIAG